MEEKNIDVNLLIQGFSNKISELINDNIVKDTIIRQLSLRVEELSSLVDSKKNND